MSDILEFVDTHYAGLGRVYTGVDGLHIFRSNTPTKAKIDIYEPCLCVSLRGLKHMKVGDHSATSRDGNFFIVATFLPCVSHILKASADEPYTAVVLRLSLEQIFSVLSKSRLNLENIAKKPSRGLYFSSLSDELLDSLKRLLSLAKNDEDYLASLAIDEIIFRLLSSDCGEFLSEFLQSDSVHFKMAKIITQIKQNFTQKLDIKSLASEVGVSESSLYHHFKQLTATSPNQFIKILRLNEARNLIQVGGLSVSQAAFGVGYESPSQFSREYSRNFGISPSLHKALE